MTVELIVVDFSFQQRGGTNVSVLESLSLEIETGKVAAIVGPSGCGKSTILRLIAGLLKPSRGTILVEGNPAEQSRREGAFGFVFQSPALLPWRTVARNVQLPLELRGLSTDAEAVEHVLSGVGLRAWTNRHPHELSGGMQQRVALARALVANPRVLLLDEPFSQLDELLRFELLFSVQDHAGSNGVTVVLVTHDVSEAVIAADVVYVLSDRPVLNAERIDVPLPRPRSLASADQPLFHELVSRVRVSLVKHRNETANVG